MKNANVHWCKVPAQKVADWVGPLEANEIAEFLMLDNLPADMSLGVGDDLFHFSTRMERMQFVQGILLCITVKSSCFLPVPKKNTKPGIKDVCGVELEVGDTVLVNFEKSLGLRTFVSRIGWFPSQALGVVSYEACRYCLVDTRWSPVCMQTTLESILDLKELTDSQDNYELVVISKVTK